MLINQQHPFGQVKNQQQFDFYSLKKGLDSEQQDNNKGKKQNKK